MATPQLIYDEEFEQMFADELDPGHELMHGQYKIETFLNAGGFGITYTATDSLDRKVVIKECFPGSFCRRTRAHVQARSRSHQRELTSIVRLFVQEARSLAKLDHPNIVRVHQVFEENNTAYMALDFIEGWDMLDVIESPQLELEPQHIEKMLRKLLSAVGYVHRQGLLHRDISPDNILIDQKREPMLIDFGAAREEAGKQSRILSALRVVKDGYSPQEFYIAGSEQGPYSDLYALGASFYHIITGELPPNSQARLAAVASGEADPYLPLAERVPGYRPEFLEAIDTSLAILPKDRIPTAEDWLDRIRGAHRVLPLTPSHEMESDLKRAKAKSRALLLLGAVAVVGAVAAGVFAQTGILSDIRLGAERPAALEVQGDAGGVAVPLAPATAGPDSLTPELTRGGATRAVTLPLEG